MTQPFLTIVTRACKRPILLSNLIDSILRQTDRDIEQIFIVDRSGSHPEGNVLWANRQLAKCVGRVRGQYVMFGDDDGALISRELVRNAKRAANRRKKKPGAFLVRSVTPSGKAGFLTFLPPADVWAVDWNSGARPPLWAGHGGNWIVRADLWKAIVGNAYNEAIRGGDWHFGTKLTSDRSIDIMKLDIVAYASMQRGAGVIFEKCSSKWWEEIVRKYSIKKVAKNDWRLDYR